jgi:hypothetical protein
MGLYIQEHQGSIEISFIEIISWFLNMEHQIRKDLEPLGSFANMIGTLLGLVPLRAVKSILKSKRKRIVQMILTIYYISFERLEQ